MVDCKDAVRLTPKKVSPMNAACAVKEEHPAILFL